MSALDDLARAFDRWDAIVAYVAAMGGGGGGGLRVIPANDEDKTVDAFNGTTVVLYTALTAPRTVTLSSASGPAQIVILVDEAGNASSEHAVSLAAADGDSLYAPTDLLLPYASITKANDPETAAWVSIDDAATLESEIGNFQTQLDALTAQVAGVSIVRAFPFAFDTPDLLTGAALYTPTPGDILLDAWIEIDTAWDGTTPFGDIGSFAGTASGLFAFASGGIVMSNADADYGNGVAQNNGFPTLAGRNAINATRLGKFTTADPIKVCVSQDGTNTGDDPASTQGAAVLYLKTVTPVSVG